jgi:acid phosphatase type 7
MMTTRLCSLFLLLICASGNILHLGAAGEFAPADPYTVYCTWTNDPTTQMVIHFHDYASNRTETRLEFRRKGRSEWTTAHGTSKPHPYTGSASTTDPTMPMRLVHTVHLTGLRRYTDYEFRFSEEGEIYRFRTMPADLTETELRIAIGGDLYHIRSEMQNTMWQVAERDPHFVIVGGDWAYADGLEVTMWRWDHLWEDWMRSMKDSEGRLIPVVPVIGNHETIDGYYHTREYSPYFYSYFAFPSEGYGALDFGDYLSVVVLDTEHSNPVITGTDPQTSWLEKALNQRAGMKHIIAIHHLTAYPSHRDMKGARETRIRIYWHPLFEQYDVGLVFEHHDHTYHRTRYIRDGNINPWGVKYLGAGNWGTRTRDVWNPHTTWYLEEAFGATYKAGIDEDPANPHPLTGTSANPENARHFYLLRVTDNEIVVESVNGSGTVFHSFAHPSRQIRAEAQKIPAAEVNILPGVPSHYTLFQNYPNPFNRMTVIRFGVPERSHVRISIHNVEGEKVKLLLNEDKESGYHHVLWQTEVSSGIYYYTIEATSLENPGTRFIKRNKMVYLK